jgi:hypothetical protein
MIFKCTFYNMYVFNYVIMFSTRVYSDRDIKLLTAVTVNAKKSTNR